MDTILKNAKILVVDDKQSNINVLCDFLEIQGYKNIKTTTDPRKVVQLLTDFEPDLILLDLLMPYLSGFEVLEQLHAILDPGKYLPILVLTADVTIESRRKALLDGASDFITKPFDLIEMQAKVNTHLQIRLKNELIKEYADKQEKLIATKDKFFSIISHDLRNPFMGITNFTKILLKNIDTYDTKDIEGHLQLIHSTAHQGRELLENLLKWSKSQTGEIEVNKQRFNLNETVSKCKTYIQQQADNKKINLIVDVSDDLFLESDQDMLETILRNLLSNAIKFTPASGSVSLIAKKLGDSVEISVSDTGIGILEADMAKLFRIDSKLQSRRGTADETGSGLGLILCKEFCDKLKGSIMAESEKAKGTTFKLSIPINS